MGAYLSSSVRYINWIWSKSTNIAINWFQVSTMREKNRESASKMSEKNRESPSKMREKNRESPSKLRETWQECRRFWWPIWSPWWPSGSQRLGEGVTLQWRVSWHPKYFCYNYMYITLLCQFLKTLNSLIYFNYVNKHKTTNFYSTPPHFHQTSKLMYWRIYYVTSSDYHRCSFDAMF